MDAFTGPLAHIQEELVSKVPEMAFGLNGGSNDINDLPGGLLVFTGDGLIV